VSNEFAVRSDSKRFAFSGNPGVLVGAAFGLAFVLAN
jgi:hypothetical protein